MRIHRYLESTAAHGERCPLSACWDDFQTDLLVHFGDDGSPDSSRCFQSVLSHPDEPDIYLEEHHQPSPLYDDPESFWDLYPGERIRLKANDDDDPGDGRFQGGPDIRLRRSVDDVEDRHRKLCAALRYLQITFLWLSIAWVLSRPTWCTKPPFSAAMVFNFTLVG